MGELVTPQMDPAMPVLEHDGRTLDWRPRFDPRSLDHRMGAGVTLLPATGRLWKHGAVLDQGREGACVGMGCAGEAAAEPVPVPDAATFDYARELYKLAQSLDEWPGDDYAGTSVLAGMKAGQRRGLWKGYRWALTAEGLAAGVVAEGPAVIGVEWRAGAYSTDALGVLRPSGDVVGGHCLCILGFVPAGLDPNSTLARELADVDLYRGYLALEKAPAFVILNSWGPGFGMQGLALVPVDVMRAWVRAGGEFAIPVDRSQPRLRRKRAPATIAAPVEAAADHTLHLAARELQDGDRVTLDWGAVFDQDTATVTGRPRLVTGWRGELVRVQSTVGVFTLRASEQVTVRRTVA